MSAVETEGFPCPKCRAVNYPGLMAHARCHRCHELLRQCRYCRFERGGLCTYESDRRPPLREEDDKPYCEAFESDFASREAAVWARPVTGTARVAALLVAVLAMVGVLLALLSTTGQHTMRVEPVDSRAYVFKGRASPAFDIEADPAEAVTLRVEPGITAWFHLLPPAPEPLSVTAFDVTQYRFALPDDGRLRVSLRLEQHEPLPGPLPLSVSLLDDQGEVTARATVVLEPRELPPAS